MGREKMLHRLHLQRYEFEGFRPRWLYETASTRMSCAAQPSPRSRVGALWEEYFMSKSAVGLSAAVACSVVLSSNARALGEEVDPDPRATLLLERDARLFPAERPWLYVDDAKMAKPGAVTA